MSRIIQPVAVDAALQLLTEVRTRNTALGTESPIKLLLTQHNIDLDIDADRIKEAQVHDQAATALRSQSENYTALRNLKSEPALKTVSSMGQVLKTFYKPSFTEVALWGIDITATGKITYPASAVEQRTLALNLWAKNATYPAGASPLSAFIAKEGIDPDVMMDAFIDAVAFDTKATQKRNDAQNEIELRNQKMAPVLEHLRLIGTYLMDFYHENPREVGLWGFLIDENASKPTERTTKIKLLDKATLNGVIIGGTITNVGEVEVHLYKGKTTVGNPIILQPEGVFGVPKGYSIITISNPSPLKTAVVKALVGK
ncbi:MAG: hypothetical protein JWP69_144 [Flaviaesturariibacter sp.]|nr:hypothetical protein [Flaviaesturariibacter sp.]